MVVITSPQLCADRPAWSTWGQHVIPISVMTYSSMQGKNDLDSLIIWRGHKKCLGGNSGGFTSITQVPAKQRYSTLCGDIRLSIVQRSCTLGSVTKDIRTFCLTKCQLRPSTFWNPQALYPLMLRPWWTERPPCLSSARRQSFRWQPSLSWSSSGTGTFQFLHHMTIITEQQELALLILGISAEAILKTMFLILQYEREVRAL